MILQLLIKISKYFYVHKSFSICHEQLCTVFTFIETFRGIDLFTVHVLRICTDYFLLSFFLFVKVDFSGHKG